MAKPTGKTELIRRAIIEFFTQHVRQAGPNDGLLAVDTLFNAYNTWRNTRHPNVPYITCPMFVNKLRATNINELAIIYYRTSGPLRVNLKLENAQ